VIVTRITGLFPLWALLCSALAYGFPALFVELQPAIVPLLGLVMFGMGVTLTTANFLAVFRRPLAVFLGICLQFGLMPLIGWALGHTLQLPVQVTAGLILLGSCPGGTASNVICYLARGDVALSITLTAVSTTLAVFVTPILTWLYAGQMVAVPTGEMLLSILMVVLVPVLAGLALNHYQHKRLALIKHLFPMVSVGAIVLIIAVIVALNRDQFDILGGRLASAVVLHNLIGLSAGYALAKLVTRDRRQARTLAIEVGMQNSGLAVALSLQYFSAMAALPGALFSVWHNLSGSLLASWWARRNA